MYTHILEKSFPLNHEPAYSATKTKAGRGCSCEVAEVNEVGACGARRI